MAQCRSHAPSPLRPSLAPASSLHYLPPNLPFSPSDPSRASFPQVLSIDGPGGSVAELPVFDGGSYPASVSAVEDSTLLFIAKQDFHALCVAHPQVALKVLRVIGARLRKLIGIIEELSFTTVRNRLAAFLVRMARHQGARVEAGFEITLPMSNQELASQIGTVRELVSRNLSRLQSEKLIQMDGRKIVVNVKALEKELEGEPTP